MIITGNQSSTALANGATFTGSAAYVGGYTGVAIAVKSDQRCVVYAEFSPDGENWDSSITYRVESGVNEVHRLTVTRAYFRVRVTNDSGNAQTYLRAQCLAGDFQPLSAPLNLPVQLDADAAVSRSFSEEFTIARGGVSGMSIVNKFGRNTDVDTASVPEDVWNGGSTYAGFPTGAPEEFQVFSASASDTGILTITYLASSTATAYSTGTIQLNGTTPVNSGITGYRMHSARYASGSATGFNLGAITVRHRTTTANVFCAIPIGRSQTNCAAYTVPAGSTAYIRRLFCRVIGSTTGQVDGALWIRELNGSPRLRRPFTAGSTAPLEESPYGGLAVSEGSDIMVRISSASANNLDVVAGYDLVLVTN